MVSPEGSLITLSFSMEFEVTNNMAEYEALILMLPMTKNMNIECLMVYGDSELVVRQIRNHCRPNTPN